MNVVRCAATILLLLLPSLAFASDEGLQEIGRLLISGRGAEARSRIEQLRDSHAARGNADDEAAMWLLLGLVDTSWQGKPAAIATLRTAAEKFRAARDTFGEWFALWTIAHLETRDVAIPAAMKAYEDVFRALDAAEAPDARFSMDAMITLAKVFGADTAPPGDPFPSNSTVMKALMLPFAQMVSHDSYAQILIDAGELERAEEHLRRAQAASPMMAALFEGPIATRYGQLRQRQWRLDEAHAYYMKALQHSETILPILLPPIADNDPMFEVKILSDLAELELLRGHLDEALAWNDRALKRTREWKDPRRVARELHNRASLLENGGRYAPALTTWNEALTLARETNAVDLIAEIQAELATAHVMRGSYGTAAAYVEKAIASYQSMNQPYLEAGAWLMLAEVYALLDATSNVENAFEKARELAQKSGFKAAGAMVDLIQSARKLRSGGSRAEFEAAMRELLATPEGKAAMMAPGIDGIFRDSFLATFGDRVPERPPIEKGAPPIVASFQAMLRGKAALERRELRAARHHFEESLLRNPNSALRASLLGAIGATHWGEGTREKAIEHLAQAADALDVAAGDVKIEELLTSFLGANRRWYFDMLIEMLVHERRAMEAFNHAERARARAFLQVIGNHRISASSGADPLLVAEAENVRATIAQREKELLSARPEDAKRAEAELQRARDHYRTIVIRMKTKNDEYADLTTIVPADLTKIGTDLPANTTLLSYYVSAHAVHAWIVDRDMAHYERLPLDASALQPLTCWAERLGSIEGRSIEGRSTEGQRGSEVPPSQCFGNPGSADEAYLALIAPVRKHIKQKRLLIVPHNVLHYIPFAALRNPDTGLYLVQDYTLLFTPSASAIRFLRDKETPVHGKALVLGNPASPRPDLDPLPGAEEEASFAGGALSAKPHLGANACETLLYGLDRQYDLVHLAAHAFYDSSDPLFSRIALAGDDKNDGSLTVHEILSSVDLREVNLVILSACRSGVGQRSGGDEIVGLTRALLYAGTPGVISTLWNIADAASAKLMNTFYEELANGESIADALRHAQLEAIESSDRNDPRFWAAFMLTGDPQGRWNQTNTATIADSK